MKNINDKNFIISELGVFSLYDVLIKIEYPTLFVCKDVFSAFYLFYETDYDHNVNEWLIMKISKSQYWDLKVGNKSLQETFSNSIDQKWYLFREVGKFQELSTLELFPRHLFPFKREIFISKSTVSSENYLIKESYEKEQPIFDIKLNTVYSRNGVSIEPLLLENFSKNARLLFKDFGVPDSSMRLSLENGSTIIRFSFDQENLFSHDAVSQSFSALNKALNSKEAIDIVDAFKGDKNKISKFRDLLETIRKTDNDVSIISSSTSLETQIFKVINQRTLIDFKSQIDKIVIEENPTRISILGDVYAVNTENRKIEFTNKNLKYKAELSENLTHTQLVVNTSYYLEVIQQKIVYLDGKIKETKYKVVKADAKP
jgi:hypothetical protein